MDSNPICQPSPANKMKCYFLDYVQLLMIGLAGWWTRTPSANPLQPKKWNATFWITFNFWWLAGLVNGLKPHPPPLSSQRNEMLIFLLCSTSNDQPGLSMDLNPIHHLCPAKKWNAHILIMLTSDDWPGWSMDSNPIHHSSPAENMKCSFLYYIQLLMLARLVNGLKPHPPPLSSQKMKCSFLDYVQLLIIGQAGQWTRTPSATPLRPENEMLIFGLCSTSDYWPGWSMDSNPICQPSPTNKMKCSFLEYVPLLMISLGGQWTRTPSASPLQPKKWNATFWITFNFWWLAGLVNGLKPHPPPLSSQRNEMLIFVLCSTSNDQPGLSMDLNPIHHLCPAKKWNAHILIMFNFWWLAGLVNGLKPHPPPLSSQKKWNACF